ncbi:MAG: hypothetical protein DMF28_10130 [Verrucomicrobia bacterium]|nr:MAG: hypothetical protein DMF28_10130 [Verrucomicrobiota bacterium]
MQNAQNLMSSFEFIAALMSIIIGLGVTNLLAGAGRAFYRRKENPLDEVHIVLTIATLLLLVLQWWVTFRWNTEENWTFDKFLVLTAWTVTLTARAITPRSLRCVCSTSRKRQFMANFFSQRGTCRSSRNMRCSPAAASLPADVVTIGSSRGTNLSRC